MKKITDILQEIRPDFDFSKSDNFIEDKILDSFDVVSLVSELEDAFGITIDGLDVIPENFVNVKTIEQLIVKSGGRL